MESKKSKLTKSINVCYGVYLNQIEMAKNGLLSTDDFGKLVIAMYDYEVNDIEPDLSESTPQFQIAWSCCQPSVTKRKRKKGYNQKHAEKKKAQEMAQNEEIIEKEYNYTKLQPNTSFYPTYDSKNQEYDDEVNVTQSNPIEIDYAEEEMNVIESTDFIVGNDDEDDFRELLREHVDLLGCMSYDGLTKHKVAYDFLTNSAITRQMVDNILMEERKRRMESKWKIA